MPKHPTRMLGCVKSDRDPRTLRLRDYLPPRLPPLPVQCLWQTNVARWFMGGNDRYGNCTTVTAANALHSLRHNDKSEKPSLTDAEIIDAARRIGGLHGFSILERLKIWRRSGLWDNQIHAFAEIPPSNPDIVKTAIHEFGFADLGIDLADAWQTEEIWDTGHGRAFEPGSWGAHSVPAVGYDADYLYLISWSDIQPMTWAALEPYCFECYATINPDWTGTDGISPSGFAYERLESDLATVTQ